MHRHPSRRAFTLVELLLVIGILLLAIAIAFPVMATIRSGARRTTCTSNLRQLGLAYQMYVDDFGTYPGPYTIAHYDGIRDRRIFFCPDDTTMRTAGAASSYGLAIDRMPDLTPIWEAASLDPGQVLVSCDHHLDRRVISVAGDNPRLSDPGFPYHLILRASGQVQRVPLGSVRRLYLPGSQPTFRLTYPGEPGYDRATAVSR